jgi:hypothetical protein
MRAIGWSFCRGSFYTLLALSLCGCLGYHGSKEESPTIQDRESLVYLDFALKPVIPCEGLSAEELPSGRTRVHARFANKQNHTAECQIKVRFKDDTGRVIDETGWMPFLLPRREVTQFEHTSLCTGVKDFTILLRAARG